jgi:hypothetical protein
MAQYFWFLRIFKKARREFNSNVMYESNPTAIIPPPRATPGEFDF